MGGCGNVACVWVWHGYGCGMPGGLVAEAAQDGGLLPVALRKFSK